MPSPPTTRPGIERISVRNLCVDYHGVVAVHDATLHLDAGTICALVGMNGAGKSTLFKALMGFVRPSAGSIAIDGQPLRQARRRRAVAYVPQTESVDWNFPINVHEVVMMGRYGAMNLLRIPRPADREAVREALERVELWPLRHRQIGALSGGQRKRAFLARALAQGASVMLLDEPFNGVDIRTEQLMIELFQQFRREGRTLMIATHDLSHVTGFCDQVVLINKTVLAYGETSSVFTSENLALTFGGLRLEAEWPAPRRDRPLRLPMTALLTWLLEPLQQDFMVRALLISILVSCVCGLLSCFMTLKGWALMGDAVSHAVMPGVVIAYALNLPFAVGAFVFGVGSVAVIGYIKQMTRIKEDTVIGLVFTGFFALGLTLISKVRSTIDLSHILFGNVLGISSADILQTVLISALVLAVLLVFHRDLILFCFDPTHARSIGIHTGVLHYLLLSVLSLTAVAGLQTVGIILVVAMLVTPGATAYLLTDRFDRMAWIAMLSAVLSSIGGIYWSYWMDASSAGCIVLVQTLLFLIAFLFAPRYGLLAQRRRSPRASRFPAE